MGGIPKELHLIQQGPTITLVAGNALVPSRNRFVLFFLTCFLKPSRFPIILNSHSNRRFFVFFFKTCAIRLPLLCKKRKFP